MFFFLSVLAMVAYSVQSTLLVHYARKIDGMSVGIFRSLSLAISMLPLLFLVGRNDFSRVFEFWPDLVLAGITGSISTILGFWALKFLPAGIQSAIGMMIRVIFVFVLSFLIFGEKLTLLPLLFAGIILIGGIGLGLQNHHMPHLDKNTKKGILLSFAAAAVLSVSIIFVSLTSRELNPALAGYIWEFSIGIFALMWGLLRQRFSQWRIAPIGWREFGKIALVSWPTLIGTGAFAFAVTMGPVGIFNAIGAGAIFMTVLLSHFWYQEKLNARQILWICVVVLGIVGLKLAEV